MTTLEIVLSIVCLVVAAILILATVSLGLSYYRQWRERVEAEKEPPIDWMLGYRRYSPALVEDPIELTFEELARDFEATEDMLYINRAEVSRLRDELERTKAALARAERLKKRYWNKLKEAKAQAETPPLFTYVDNSWKTA